VFTTTTFKYDIAFSVRFVILLNSKEYCRLMSDDLLATGGNDLWRR
jgi:hypothetical protein